MNIKEDKEICILEDLNVCTGNTENNPLVGKYNDQVINDNGECSTDFCRIIVFEDNEWFLSS